MVQKKDASLEPYLIFFGGMLGLYIFLALFTHLFNFLRTLHLSLSVPRRSSDLGSLIRLFSTPSPRDFFHRDKASALSSIVDSHQITPTQPANSRRSQQLVALFFLIFASKPKKSGPRGVRTSGPTLR